MDDAMVQDFRDGVDAYWGGEVPEGWKYEALRNASPYLMGWYLASMWETMPGYVRDRDGDPYQEED